jgi:hypothetical protein
MLLAYKPVVLAGIHAHARAVTLRAKAEVIGWGGFSRSHRFILCFHSLILSLLLPASLPEIVGWCLPLLGWCQWPADGGTEAVTPQSGFE